jgi:hypothetical protein
MLLVPKTSVFGHGIIVGVHLADFLKTRTTATWLPFVLTGLLSVLFGLSSLRNATSDGSNER